MAQYEQQVELAMSADEAVHRLCGVIGSLRGAGPVQSLRASAAGPTALGPLERIRWSLEQLEDRLFDMAVGHAVAKGDVLPDHP